MACENAGGEYNRKKYLSVVYMNKEVIIFPYINLDKVIKMDEFEIHPYDTFDFSNEWITDTQKQNLDSFVDSFRQTFFKKWETPKRAQWIWILKYNETILRTQKNTELFVEKTQLLFLLLKLHISHDFFNDWMNFIDVRTFRYFYFNLNKSLTNKFWSSWKCSNLYSTIPEDIKWLWSIKFYPIQYSTNSIDPIFRIIPWWCKYMEKILLKQI